MNQDMPEREMHDAVCAECGNETQVPFQPSGDRPVYCRDCFSKRRNDRQGGGGNFSSRGPREMHDAVCATCGAATQVPFKPTEGRPVYCREHFQRD